MDSSTASSLSRKDPAWKYATLTSPNNKNDLKCNFCGKVSKGGVYRAKQHLVGGFRNVTACPKCPPTIREEIKNYMHKKAVASLEEKERELMYDNDEDLGYSDEDVDVEVNQSGKKVVGSSSIVSKRKKAKQKGPLHLFFTPTVEKIPKDRKMQQTSINEACKKELRGRACEDIASWIYDSGVPFNCVNHPTFKKMIDSIGQYGPGMKPPSYHEIRVPLLKKEVVRTQDLLKSHEEEWIKYGCSIMADGWTDKKHRTLINFLVNSPKGSVFIESVDASSYSTTGEAMFSLLDNIVERIGEANVVQVVTDNAAYNIATG